jgi:hypothetical protein
VKIAVCVSGQQRSVRDFSYSTLEERMFQAFRNVEVDYYYQTWNNNQFNDRARDILVLPEPNIHYHPVHEIINITGPWIARRKADTKNLWEKLSHGTKQILAHNYLCKTISKQYDMIVRCRYDIYFSDVLDYKKLLEKSHDEGPYGFARQSGKMYSEDLKFLNEPCRMEKLKTNERWQGMLSDNLIFHRPEHFNTEYVDYLHNNKELVTAEAGWYQVLSQPYGDHHTNFIGGVLGPKDGRLK